MSHQTTGGSNTAYVTNYSPEAHHDKPEEHEENTDLPESLEEALTGE